MQRCGYRLGVDFFREEVLVSFNTHVFISYAHADNLEAARMEVAARKGRGTSRTITTAIREAFDAMVGTRGEVSQKDLLDATVLEEIRDRSRAHDADG